MCCPHGVCPCCVAAVSSNRPNPNLQSSHGDDDAILFHKCIPFTINTVHIKQQHLGWDFHCAQCGAATHKKRGSGRTAQKHIQQKPSRRSPTSNPGQQTQIRGRKSAITGGKVGKTKKQNNQRKRVGAWCTGHTTPPFPLSQRT